jgi:mxaJ protein
MFSRCLSALALLAALSAQADERVLRVCADPDNLPYSREDGSGFENRIARLVAADMNAKLAYHWLPQIRGWVRKSMGEGLCDVFIGVPAGFDPVLTTKPYYRSSYVFVNRPGASPLTSFDDPRLKALRIGVQLVGDDLAATPPGHVLAQRGAVANVVGFTVLGEAPAAQRMAQAIAKGELDAALIWGPQAGYFARRESLSVSLAHAPEVSKVPFEFAIAMGVRRGDRALRDELDAVIDRRRSDIDAILTEYGVPRVATRQ